MIERQLQKPLLRLARQYPVVAVTGPRQSGKTTLCRASFPRYFYCNLEDMDTRTHAEDDPRDFLEQSDKMIIDEIQRVPSLASYIQGIVDFQDRPGQFILTGSHQFELTHTVSQSLAGRVALLRLLPFSLKELGERGSYLKLLYRGFYPRIVAKKLNPTEAFSFYVDTYLKRDMREIKAVQNLRQFQRFLQLCASLTGQIVNKQQLGNDIGIDGKTVDSWLSVLEASYIIFLLQPHFKNFRKRIVKRPKLYFCDVGLAAFLLGIKEESHVSSHPLKGALFENLVIAEKLKQQFNTVHSPSLYYFRDNTGNEVDLLDDRGDEIVSYEIKTSKTLNPSLFKGLNFYKTLNPGNKKSFLIYTGDKAVSRYGHKCLPYKQL